MQGWAAGWGHPALRMGYKKCSGAGRCGERTERCQWQKQRSERVAAVKISSVRRKAAQKFWAPQQGHRPLRKRILWCVGEGLCPSRGRPQGSPLRSVTRSAVGRVVREAGPYGGVVRSAAQIKGGPAGRPYGFYIHFISYIHLYPLFICALRRINLPGAGVCPCRPTHCGPRPGAFPGRWLFPPGRSRCGVRPGSPGPGL